MFCLEYLHNSYLTVIGVHASILLVVDLCSLLAYFMMTQPLSIAGKLPIKTLVARQLPALYAHAYTDVHIHTLCVTLNAWRT